MQRTQEQLASLSVSNPSVTLRIMRKGIKIEKSYKLYAQVTYPKLPEVKPLSLTDIPPPKCSLRHEHRVDLYQRRDCGAARFVPAQCPPTSFPLPTSHFPVLAATLVPVEPFLYLEYP